MKDRYSEWRKLNFSNISNFDKDNYIFLTHSVEPPSKNNTFKSMIEGTVLSSSDQDFNVFYLPIRIREKKRISCSLTTSEDYYSYGRIGYILSFPIENILYVGQAPFSKTNKQLRELPLVSPSKVLSKEVLFNEIVIEGTTLYGEVRPIAIFINLTNATKLEIYLTNKLLEQVKSATFDLYPILDLTSIQKTDDINNNKARK